jgi:hypothetical protein
MPSVRANDWFLVGCVSTQDRCKSMLIHNGISLNIAKCGFVEIVDEPSIFSKQSAARRDANRTEIRQIAPPSLEILQHGLLEPLLPLQEKIEEWIAASGGNVVLDVSTFPERFCFPIIRWITESPHVNNLVVTYMLAEKYTQDDLGYDSQDWGQLPTFVNSALAGQASVEHVMVGVGFLPYSLPDWLRKTYATPNFKISLLMPFPAAPSNVNRAWEFVRRIEKDLNLKDDRQIIRIAAHDLSGAFQRIDLITRGGNAPAVFAPYGPKAHSVAMCLHALRNSSEAYFTQPTYYHPEYSTGIALDAGVPAGYSYAVRLGGQDFY